MTDPSGGKGPASGASFAHHAITSPRMGTSAPRVDPEVLGLLGALYIPDVSDAVGRLYTMDSGIRSLYTPARRLVGQALTVKAPPGDNFAVHAALAMSAPGDVLVVDWRGYLEACATGAESLVVPIHHGLAGVVVDGAWRDIEEIRGFGLPIYGRGVSPFSPPKAEVGEINVAVACGGVVVEPGDVILGDEEGVVVVPLRHASHIAASLKPYPRPMALTDHPVSALEARVAERSAIYRAAFDQHGGEIVEI